MTASLLVRQARKSVGLTQTELAARLGVSQPVVARLERPGSNPTWDTLIRVLRLTGHGLELTSHRPPLATVDLGQLRERLALSPAERLQLFQESQHNLDRLRATARRREDG